jgi:hypothetical protein
MCTMMKIFIKIIISKKLCCSFSVFDPMFMLLINCGDQKDFVMELCESRMEFF